MSDDYAQTVAVAVRKQKQLQEIAVYFGEAMLRADCRLRKLRYAPCVADMCWQVADSSAPVVDLVAGSRSDGRAAAAAIDCRSPGSVGTRPAVRLMIEPMMRHLSHF